MASTYKSETTGSQFRSDLDTIDNLHHVLKVTDESAKYQDFLPTWNTLEHYPPYEEIKVKDRALFADKDFPNLLPADKLKSGEIKTKQITPKFGTEIIGIQISKLSPAGKDELALLSAQRGLVIFRDQDFVDLGPKGTVDFHKHFGPLHIHPTSGSVPNYPEIHLVYRRAHDTTMEKFFQKNLSGSSYHSDNSYEFNPLSYTSLTMIESPPVGGDTVFVDMEEAYRRLSPLFKERLEGLKAIHSSIEQAAASRNYGGIARREGIETAHPIVRTHPVTGKKSLYVNPQFTRRIADFKLEESDAILKLLFNHITQSVDFSLRATWEPNTVVFWDNRKLVHTAVSDWDIHGDHRRHAFRLGARGERPN